MLQTMKMTLSCHSTCSSRGRHCNCLVYSSSGQADSVCQYYNVTHSTRTSSQSVRQKLETWRTSMSNLWWFITKQCKNCSLYILPT